MKRGVRIASSPVSVAPDEVVGSPANPSASTAGSPSSVSMVKDVTLEPPVRTSLVSPSTVSVDTLT